MLIITLNYTEGILCVKIIQCLFFETINIIGFILDEVCPLTACLSLPNILFALSYQIAKLRQKGYSLNHLGFEVRAESIKKKFPQLDKEKKHYTYKTSVFINSFSHKLSF